MSRNDPRSLALVLANADLGHCLDRYRLSLGSVGMGAMSRFLVLATFAFLAWMIANLRECPPDVPPLVEAGAIRIIQELPR